jgi:hypothetical protein
MPSRAWWLLIVLIAVRTRTPSDPSYTSMAAPITVAAHGSTDAAAQRRVHGGRSHRWRTRSVLLCSFAIVQLSCSNDAPVSCDLSLLRAASGAYPYQARGDRCEGQLATEISGSPLEVSSVAFEDDDEVCTAGTCTVTWKGLDPASLTMRSTVHGVNYRLDTRNPRRRYSWPSAILDGLRLRFEDLSVLASRMDSSMGPSIDVYVPVTTTVPREARPGVRVDVLPDTDFSLLATKLDCRREANATLIEVRPATDIGRTLYPAGLPVNVYIDESNAHGLCVLTFQGERLGRRGTVTKAVWVDVP